MTGSDGYSDRVCGCLLGQAVGDAIGLPREGLSRERARRLFGGPPLRHRLVFRHGLGSDETEHACMTAVALIRCDGSAADFARRLAWQLRGWLLSLPPGIGLATARACAKLCVGVPPRLSGVRSAGNGPLMRAPILGASLAHRPERLREFVAAATAITHTDPRAEEGARLVAAATAEAVLAGRALNPDDFLARALADVRNDELASALRLAREHLRRAADPMEFAAALGLDHGVSGYVNHTAPVAVYCWLRHLGDFRAAVESAVLLGGDTDSTGGVAGALAGATTGRAGIPPEWLDGLWEWPRSPRYAETLAQALAAKAAGGAHDRPARPPRWCWPAVLPRNLFALLVILAHGFRRIAPPY